MSKECCLRCGRLKPIHRAKDGACPFGVKDRTGGYQHREDGQSFVSLRDVNTLEAKCEWQSEMLERAKVLIILDPRQQEGADWLSDLEKGPKG